MRDPLTIGMMNMPRVNDGGGKTAAMYEKAGFVVKELSRRDIDSNNFADLDMLHCPGGHHLKFSARGIRNIRRYIRNGHGLMGICAGCHFIAETKLLNISLRIVRATGIYDMRLVKRHPITKGFRLVPRSPEKRGYNPVPHTKAGRISIHRGNGGFIMAGRGVDVIATYDNDDVYGAIVAGRFGKGRVVAISCHPQITADWADVPSMNKKTDPRLAKLFSNAALFCAERR